MRKDYKEYYSSGFLSIQVTVLQARSCVLPYCHSCHASRDQLRLCSHAKAARALFKC